MTTPANSAVTESQNLALASCNVQYFDVLYSRPVQHKVECVIVLNPNTSSPVTSDAVDEIEQHRLRCEVADVLGEANKMASGGKFREARDLLKGATARIQRSRVSRQVLAVHLLETLQESLEGIQDKVTYVQHGKSVMQNYAGSHWQQRSNTNPSRAGYMKQKAELPPTGLLQATSAPAPPSRSVPTVRTVTDDDDPYSCYSPYRKTAKMRVMSQYAVTSKGKKK